MSADAGELLERYEATGDERAFADAQRLYERALAERPDPLLLRDYGYLLECHGRYAIRRRLARPGARVPLPGERVPGRGRP